MLLCTVRACGLALTRDGRRLVCPNAHSFDVARSGYVNLLQPQDRRSKEPGDSAEVIVARRRLHDRGVTGALQIAVNKLLLEPTVGRAELQLRFPGDVDTVLDVGCGDGFYIGSLAQATGCKGHGVDISTPAIDAAARRYQSCEFVVANADRFLPYSDASFSIVMSIAARMNPPEFRRVLHPDGLLLIAVPAPDDLIELRGKGRNDRVTRTVDEFRPSFRLVAEHRATTQADLDAESVGDVLKSIYRPLRTEPLVPMRVTFSLDLLVFQTAQN